MSSRFLQRQRVREGLRHHGAVAPRLRARQSRNRGENMSPRSRTRSLVIPEPQALSSERSGSPRDSSTKGQTEDATALRPQPSAGPFGFPRQCTIRQSARHHTSRRGQAGGRREKPFLAISRVSLSTEVLDSKPLSQDLLSRTAD